MNNVTSTGIEITNSYVSKKHSRVNRTEYLTGAEIHLFGATFNTAFKITVMDHFKKLISPLSVTALAKIQDLINDPLNGHAWHGINYTDLTRRITNSILLHEEN